jgi:hypothetical protein
MRETGFTLDTDAAIFRAARSHPSRDAVTK